MFLNGRKIQILEAIINDYILTGEPIGSRTITKKYNFGLSSATIRNEMSDLEDMGYISQPHASAGRAPTDKGYRLYVDKMMKYRELTPEQLSFLQNMIVRNIDKMDYLMEETAKAVSLLTNYTTIAASSKAIRTRIKLIQLLPIDGRSLAFVLITDDKTVRNQVLHLPEVPEYNDLMQISAILNQELAGKAVEDFTAEMIPAVSAKVCALGNYDVLLRSVLETAYRLLAAGETASFYLSGAKNILEFPEFSDIEKAKNLLQTFEEKDLLITLLGSDEDASMQIVIGDENNIKEMKNCSIIKTNMRADEKNYGTIGILGPTRMDYAQAASVLDVIVKTIEQTIRSLSGG